MLYIWVRRKTARYTWVQEHDKERRKQWGLGQAVTPTTWGADWYYFGTADRWYHTLYPCLCYILKVSVVTIPHFQDSCPHELYQNLQLSYHMISNDLFARTNYYLIPVVDGDKVQFMWWLSLVHRYLAPILCCVGIFSSCLGMLSLPLSRNSDLVLLWI